MTGQSDVSVITNSLGCITCLEFDVHMVPFGLHPKNLFKKALVAHCFINGRYLFVLFDLNCIVLVFDKLEF